MCCRWVGACWVRQGARYVLLCARGHTAAGAANKGRETRGGQLGGRVYMFSSGCGCWLGKWHWGASHSDGGGLWLCTCLGATQTLSHPTASLPCFTVLQCVLLLRLTHLPRHLTPLLSAAGCPADLPLSSLSHPPSAPSSDPHSARLSAAGPLPLPCIHPLAGARVLAAENLAKTGLRFNSHFITPPY